MIYAGFKVVSETGNSIMLQYEKEKNDKGSAILLPPNCTYSVEVSVKDKSLVSRKPFYFKDYYLLPIKPYSENYTIKVNFSKTKLSGKIVYPNTKILKAMEGIVVNQSHLKDYIKPRLMNKKKTSYDGTPIAKIKIDSIGMYRIFYDEILSMSGISLSSYDPTSIKLYNNGIEVPIYIYGIADNIFGEGDYFEFYGERMSGEVTYYDKYELKNLYIISVGGGSGARYIIDNQGVMDDSLIDAEFSSVTFIDHLEEDSIYIKMEGETTVDTTDFWYMNYLTVGENLSLKIPLQNFDTLTSYIDLRAYFHGTTYLIAYNPDHKIDFYYDSNLLSSFGWDGLSPYIFEYESLAVSRKDTCVFEFEVLPIDTFSTYLAMNWIEIAYKRLLKANNSRVNFTLEENAGFGNFRYKVKNLPSTSVAIYRKDLKRIENFQSNYDVSTNSYEIVFDDQLFSSNRDYVVYGLNAFLSCDTIEEFLNEDLANPLNEGEFIIITNQNLKTAAEQFKNIFELKHTVKLVGSQEIYDEFSYGKKSAFGIKNFLISAYNNWMVPPSNVLILADGSYDNNNHLLSIPNDVPITFYYDAEGHGMICSDNYYATVSGDDPIEDISISRFPARNELDINTAIQKASKYLDWKNNGIHDMRVIFAYDTTSPGADLPDYLDAKIQSYKLATMLPVFAYPEFMANKHDENGDFINQLSYGASFMTFIAHGAEQSIGSRLYLRISDVFRMYNIERLPFVNVYSCVTGVFDKPNIDSMSIGEAFVISPYGGAIAYYGSSSVSSQNFNNPLSESFFKQFTHNGVRNIGEITLYGELDFYLQQGYIGSYTDDSPYANQIRNYGLLGINLVDIKIPELSDITCSLSSYSINPNDTINVVLADTEIDDGFIQSIAIDSEDRAVAKDYSTLVSGTGENTLIMPDSMVAGGMRVITMAITQDTSVLYATYPSVLIGGIKNFYIYPEELDTMISFQICAKIANDKNIDNIYAVYKYPTDATYQEQIMVRDTIDTNLFFTSSLTPIKAKSTDQYFYYYISYSDTLNTAVYSTSKKSLIIPALPDLRISNFPYLKPTGLIPYLSIKIMNVGKRSVTNVPINFYEFIESIPTFIASDTISLEANKTKEASIQIEKNYYGNDLYIFVNPDSQSAVESNYNNNDSIFSKFNQFFAHVGSSLNDSLISYFAFSVNQHTLTDNDTNLIVFSRDIFTDSISSVSPVIMEGDEYPYIYTIISGDSSKSTSLNLSMTDSLIESGILEYIADENKYYAPNQKNVNCDIFLNREEKKYIIAQWTDSIAPIITINIENKEFTGGVVLLNSVDFGCAIEDNEAIKINKIIIETDNDTLLSSEYTVLNSKDDNSIPLKFTREYENGTHSISVTAEDIFGNKSTKSLSFLVSDQFKIIELANFPNPVIGAITRIVCDFSKVPETNILKIYGSNGALIKSMPMSQLDIINHIRYYYDLDVSALSNGTYFYIVNGTLGNEKVESTTRKMSVLK